MHERSPDERHDLRDCPPRGQLQLEESRRSFRRQVAQLKDIDDKAMRSVRTAVVVIGFVVTATGITMHNGSVGFGAGPALFTAIGVFLLTITVVAGVGTSSVTEYKNRLTDAERTRLEEPTLPVSGGSGELLRIYRSWMDALDQQLAEQVAYLTVTLFTLVFGVLTLLTAATLVVVENVSLFDGLSNTSLVLLEVTAASLVFGVSLLATRLSIKKMKGQL